MAAYWEIAAHSAYDIVPNCQFVFSHLGFWSGNFFLIAPFPGHCLLVPSFRGYIGRFRSDLFENPQDRFSRVAPLLNIAFYSVYFTVCSEMLQKCFIYTSVDEFGLSWSEVHKEICSPNGWSMLSIHSSQEQEFVAFHVVSAFNRPTVEYGSSGYRPSPRRAYLGI